MSTYTQTQYHIVFATKYRKFTRDKSGRPALFQYIAGIIRQKQGYLYCSGTVSTRGAGPMAKSRKKADHKDQQKTRKKAKSVPEGDIV